MGGLPAGQVAMVNYVAAPMRPGILTIGATVFGNEGDPNLMNNSTVATVQVKEPTVPEKEFPWRLISLIAVLSLLLVVYLLR
jgi:hypothetical protein